MLNLRAGCDLIWSDWRRVACRIRTDDLRGVRKYETIRTVLVHELAHMRHDGHGDDFKQFNAEVSLGLVALQVKAGGHLR